MRVLMRAGFDRYSGYGNDGVDLAMYLAAELMELGGELVPWPTSIFPGLPREFTDLLTQNPHGKYDAVLAFHPPFDLKPWDVCNYSRVRVGYTMWEKSILVPDDLRGHGWRNRPKDWFLTREDIEAMSMQERLDLAAEDGKEVEPADHEFRWSVGREPLTRLVVTCPSNVDCFRALDPDVPIGVVPCGIEGDRWPAVKRDPGRRLKVGMAGMLVGRKDPFVMLQAWREVKTRYPEFDGVLELKTMCDGLHPAIPEAFPDVVIHDEAWTPEQMVEWYHSLDLYVSTSRGEGNDKPAMEAMATGCAVALTDWSGHQNYQRLDNGYPLAGKLLPAYGHRDDVLDFRVDVDGLVETLWHVHQNRAEAVEKGMNGASYIRQTLSWERVAEMMRRELEAAVGHG